MKLDVLYLSFEALPEIVIIRFDYNLIRLKT